MPTSMHKLFWGAGRKAWQSFRLLRTGCLPRANACQLLTTCTGQWQHSLRSCDGFIAKLQQSYSGGRTTPEASLAVPGNGGWWYPPFDKPSSRTVVVGTALFLQTFLTDRGVGTTPFFTNLRHGPVVSSGCRRFAFRPPASGAQKFVAEVCHRTSQARRFCCKGVPSNRSHRCRDLSRRGPKLCFMPKS